MESYKNLKVYKEAPKSLKKSIEKYISDYKPSNEQMYWQLKLYEQNHLSKKEKKATNGVALIAIFLATIGFTLAIDKTTDPTLVVIMLIFLIALLILLWSGVFSEYKRQVRKIKKQLANYPELPEFKGTEKEN